MRRYRPYVILCLFWTLIALRTLACEGGEIAEIFVIRDAALTDAPAVFRIALENRLDPERKSVGFLVGDHTLEYYHQFIDYSRGTLLVATINDVVVGFVTFADSLREVSRGEREDHIQAGLGRKLRAVEPKLKFILQVGVLAAFKHRSVASRLYETLFSRFPNHHWAASIVEGPWKNEPSVLFHTKMGFVNVAYADSHHDRLGELHCGFYYRLPGVLGAP